MVATTERPESAWLCQAHIGSVATITPTRGGLGMVMSVIRTTESMSRGQRWRVPPPEPQISPSIEVRKVSVRELCDHLGIEDYARFIGLQHMHESKMIWLLLERDADGE